MRLSDRAGMGIDPETPLAELAWVPRQKVAGLERLGIKNLGGLVRHFPRRYEDRRKFADFPDGGLEDAVCLMGRVAATGHRRLAGRRWLFEVKVESLEGGIFCRPMVCRWFNLPYLSGQFAAGQRVVIYGRPKKRGGAVVMDHPEYEILEEEDIGLSSLHLGRIVPVHPAAEGLSVRFLRYLISRALEACDLNALNYLPKGAIMNPERAFRGIHFPESMEHLEISREELGLEESFVMQVAIQLRRRAWLAGGGVSRCGSGELLKLLLESLPFALTAAQKRVLEEIRHDLISERRMNRLLQGDVGSGKTVVAIAAAAHVVDAGWRVLVMAPTQILAEQHFRNFTKLFSPLGVDVGLRAGGRGGGETPLLPSRIVVGTHALLYESELPRGVGLVVIDEQHKFGVLQRSKLVALPEEPDALYMTATPIPRTLAQTLYGDLDISILSEKPPGRGEVRTVVRPAAKLPEVVKFLRTHIEAGRQAYIVYPVIEESEKLGVKAAGEEYRRWQKMLAPYEVALLHGRTGQDERDAIMMRFREGKIAALVSTTVIEVGVDVPNATLMVVENAERYGLAQLHQLRGRIGRGSGRSYCILLHGEAGEQAGRRLEVLERTSDGFEIAEEDLRIRGPGNILGTAQAGFPPLQLPGISLKREIMERAAKLARGVLADDPKLESPVNSRLLGLIRKYDQRTMG